MRVSLSPASANVLLAGEKLMANESGVLAVPCGEREVKVDHPRYQAKTVSLVARPEEETLLKARLKRPVVSLVIKSKPSGATVRLNRKVIGKARQ